MVLGEPSAIHPSGHFSLRMVGASLVDENEIMLLKKHEPTGRPLGSQSFIVGLEKSRGSILRRQPFGPKKVK